MLNAQEPFGKGKIQQFLSTLAQQHHIWIVGGTIPISSNDPNKIKAACIVFDVKGSIVARYDKIHLFDATISQTEQYCESKTVQAGDKATVINTPIGKLGLAVCCDLRFPELFRLLRHQGAELFALPAAFTVTTGKAHWKVLTQSRAIENSCYVVGACQGGTHPGGRQTYGHSIIIDAWGNVAQEKLDNLPGVIIVNIDLKKLHDVRQALSIIQHQRFLLSVDF